MTTVARYNGTIVGLTNTTWRAGDVVVRDRAATEGQLADAAAGFAPGSSVPGASIEDDLEVTAALGGATSGKTWRAGTPIETIIRDMLSPTLNPTLTPPSASISGDFPAIVKVGQEVSARTATVVLNRGSISPAYGTDGYRAGAATGYTLNLGGASVAYNQSSASASFALPAFTRHTKGAVTLTGTARYGQGQQPKNSAGEDYSTPLVAGSVSASRSITFVIPFYHGVSNDLVVTTLAGLTEDATAKENKSYSYSTSNQHCVFAYDMSFGSLSSIKDENGFEYIDGWTKSVVGECYVYVMNNKTTDPDAGYTFKF